MEHLPVKIGKQLHDATRPFAIENQVMSWWHVCTTLFILFGCLSIAAIAPWWPLSLLFSVISGLTLVRTFILYHDYMHKSLLRKSSFAAPLFYSIGLLMLSPPRYWRHSHNFHHGHVGKPLHPDDEPNVLLTSDLGSFPLMTVDAYEAVSFWERMKYRFFRHPITMLLAYVTVFFFSLCMLPLLKSPLQFWDGAVAIVLHFTILTLLWIFAGFWLLFVLFLLPYSIATAIGAYLFFAQHNYDGMRILEHEEWTYYRGAVESSSYMKLNPIMHWFTGNIGYHHIHHLNPFIPFYRLPEATKAIPELQNAHITTLKLRAIFSCLRLNLWDTKKDCLVSYRDARKSLHHRS